MRRDFQAPRFRFPLTGSIITSLVILVALIVVSAASVVNIHPGYVGVLFDAANHQVSSGFLRPGFGLKVPLIQQVQEYPTGTQVLSMVARQTEGKIIGDDSVKAQSIEGQDLFIDVTIKYHVIPERAGDLYQKWAGQGIAFIEDNAVRRAARSVLPIIAGKMGVIGIYGNERDVLEKNSYDLLKTELAKDFLELEAVQVGEVHISDALKTSLEQKVAAQQAAERAKFELDKAQTEALTAAKVAEGKANARKIEADGEAYYNLTVAKSLTAELVQLKMIEKLGDKINVMMVPNGSTPIIGLDSLFRATPTPTK
jgi:regulator of protease activity HflC (stomatin/prohibitin superfamily)